MSNKNSQKALGRAYECTVQKNLLTFKCNDSNHKHERQLGRPQADNSDEREDSFN